MATISMKQLFKLYCKLNNIEYKSGQSGVPKWFKETVKKNFNYAYLGHSYFIMIDEKIRI